MKPLCLSDPHTPHAAVLARCARGVKSVLPSMPPLLISSPILLSAHPWFHDLHDAPLRAGSGLPFPTVKRMYSPQSEAFARAKRLAQTASKAATAELLSHLNGSDFRRALAVCCNQSGVASWPASELLDALRGIYNVAELVHNFDGADTFETDNIWRHDAVTSKDTRMLSETYLLV